MFRPRPRLEALSDEALMAGLVLGEAGTDVAFVNRFQDRAYGLALSLVGDRAVAEEVAQEALLRAWRHASVFDARRGSVATWVLTITRNLAIDALRLRRTVPVDPAASVLANLADQTRGPAEAAAATDTADHLHRAVATLPVEQRRALVLAAFGGRTAQEIADSEGIPLGTAKTRIRAGMTKLRAALSEEAAAP
jgi:RNA polymerase sigma-70 factor (ECF subfamily)